MTQRYSAPYRIGTEDREILMIEPWREAIGGAALPARHATEARCTHDRGMSLTDALRSA
jgi:hypothetical protein